MKIENIKIDQLKPYEKNAKKHDKKQIEQVAKSVETFGWVQPLVVDKNNVLIIGHARLEASKHLEEYNSLKTSNADSHLILGYCYYKTENFGKAELEFIRAMSMRTGNVTAMFNISKVYQKQKEYDKAIEILQKILTFDPNHTQSKKSIHNLLKLLERRLYSRSFAFTKESFVFLSWK